MPRATVTQDVVRKELKSCPGGFVELRQLPFGKMLARRDKILRQTQEIHPNAKRGDSAKVQIDILNELSRQYDFANCIVSHNLEDDRGNLLDFNNPLALDLLDPKIGGEIESYIDELNRDDFDEQGFTPPSDSPSKIEMNGSSNESD